MILLQLIEISTLQKLELFMLKPGKSQNF